MTNDQRRRLEDAINVYGVAKSLHSGATPERRVLVEKALRRAWDSISEILNEIQKEHE